MRAELEIRNGSRYHWNHLQRLERMSFAFGPSTVSKQPGLSLPRGEEYLRTKLALKINGCKGRINIERLLL
jgi:hypothetical protein